MADLNFGGAEDEFPDLTKLNAEVFEDPDSYERWEKLVRHAEGLEGGVTRNSTSIAIQSVRRVYDSFLAKFPPFFGYWKKYADLEFAIAGTEAADMVYERGIASIPCSVDLWLHYCTFKIETTHDNDTIRDLFDRGTLSVGLDFLGHPFWDKYLEFEERLEAHDNVFTLLGRIIMIPMHQYARYFERYRQLAQSRPLSEICPVENLAQFRAEIEMDAAQNSKTEHEIESELRHRVDQYHVSFYTRCHAETTKRWPFEAEIKRGYFHVTELDDAALENWKKYLDFEEGEGDNARITHLYERCLVATAYYDEFWLRYARWMRGQPSKIEETRGIYQRGCYLYVPIARPNIRLQYALFEESTGRIQVSHDIYESILTSLPNDTEVATAWANSVRRHNGVDAAIGVYNKLIESPTSDTSTKAILLGKLADLIAKFQGATEEARQIFQSNQGNYSNEFEFWKSYLLFEINHVLPSSDQDQDHIKQVFSTIHNRTQLSTESVKKLTFFYLEYLLNQGPKDVAKEWLAVERELYG